MVDWLDCDSAMDLQFHMANFKDTPESRWPIELREYKESIHESVLHQDSMFFNLTANVVASGYQSQVWMILERICLSFFQTMAQPLCSNQVPLFARAPIASSTLIKWLFLLKWSMKVYWIWIVMKDMWHARLGHLELILINVSWHIFSDSLWRSLFW